jgi:hypothetical protein
LFALRVAQSEETEVRRDDRGVDAGDVKYRSWAVDGQDSTAESGAPNYGA